MKKISVLVVGILLGTCISQAQQLGIYEFNVGATCDAIDMKVTAQPAFATFSILSLSNVPNCQDNALEYLSNSWKQGAEDENNYYLTFTITADPTYEIDATNLNFDIYRAAQGPKKGNVWASVDGGAFVIQGATSFNIGTTLANVSVPLTINTLSGGNIVFKLSFFQANNSGVPAKMWIDNIQLVGSIPLPIELIDFTARLTDNKDVQLDWITASETNNDFFSVQRCSDGLTFETIAEVDGAGNSTTLINYRVVDREPLTGISYYRLMQTDYDGKTSYSEIVAINRRKDSEPIVSYIFPNPAASSFTISGNYLLPAVIELYDITGRQVCQQPLISKQQVVDVSSLAKGLYMWQLGNETGKLIVGN